MNNNNETLETLWKNYKETVETNWQECLAALWDDNDATLIGIGDGYAEAIDRDQAVDDDGKAIFNSYIFETGNGYDGDVCRWEFSAAEVEAFARTW